MSGQFLKNMKNDDDSTIASRRKFLKRLAYGSVLALSGCGVETTVVRQTARHGHDQAHTQPIHPLARQGYKTLSFEHTHTGEKLKLTYFERGNYIKLKFPNFSGA